MNYIYIINKNFNELFYLNFKKDKIIKESGEEYSFEIISPTKLLITWININENVNENINENVNEEYFNTNDSYLYFSELYPSLYQNFKKIFLKHKEWQDQAIINISEKKIHRIRDKDQCGNLLLLDSDKIVINWDYWGKEIFVKIDEYTFVQENLNYLSSNDIPITCPIHIFIHICCIENWKTIFDDQIDSIKRSHLYDKVEKIHLGILGSLSENDILSISSDEKFNILYINENIYLYEIPTINSIKKICSSYNDNKEIYVLYIHTKGVRRAGNDSVTTSWRKMMEYFTIINHEVCLKNLVKYDTLGCNLVNMSFLDNIETHVNKDHCYHYSGNFWWSKKSYIDKLPFLEEDLSNILCTNFRENTRYRAENWILSNYPDCLIGILFQDDTNTHPYHRYVFDYYKNMKINI